MPDSRNRKKKNQPPTSGPPEKRSGDSERSEETASSGRMPLAKDARPASHEGPHGPLAEAVEAIVARIGRSGTITAAIIGLFSASLVAYFSYLQVRATIEIPIHATQTAEARLTQAARLAGTATLAPTVTLMPTLTLTPTATLNLSPCPPGMALIPAGFFWMGAAPGDVYAEPDETPQKEIYLDAFCLDTTEVSHEAYFESLGQPLPAPSLASLPVVNVTWIDAHQYCDSHGWALPTEAQWEKAARGEREFIYPWGNGWFPDRVNYGDTLPRSLRPVSNYAAGGSPYGLLNMAGNAAEWVADWYAADWYARMPGQNPFKSIMPSEPFPTRVVRGGSFVDIQSNLRTSNRDGASLPDDQFDYLGFRCAAVPSLP